MKLLHTSDWHIGQKLHGNDRDEEHRLFFEWLKETIKAQDINLLLVSGDIFDVGFPSNNALKRYYQFLTSLVDTPCQQIIITGGNHDYISTLEAPSDVLSALNIQVIGGARSAVEEELIPVDYDGKLQCMVAAVPFLRDKDIRSITAGESYDDVVKATNSGIIKHYQQIVEAAKEQACPLIGMGHLYVQGAGLSESERDIHIGNLAGLTVDAFPDAFDYMALGHIHRPQKLNKAGTIRYSGSPIPLSFSEKTDNKKVVLLELDAKGVQQIETIDVPAFRKLISFSGDFQKVYRELKSYRGDSELDDWAELVVEELQMDTTLRTEFEKLIEEVNQADNHLTIVKPQLKFNISDQSEDESTNTSLSDLSVGEVFERLIDSKELANKNGLNTTFNELLDNYYHQSENK
ncbi:MAG: exonuclease SbcCD subunit D C-terminal domain-containing protein [Carboxylicivirga sp.]|jgi:exonuclease SbcD|nr:exonuclease SbcCD subunit D C-terminal domain-containing protein [Carboxylicivirga sp.]